MSLGARLPFSKILWTLGIMVLLASLGGCSLARKRFNTSVSNVDSVDGQWTHHVQAVVEGRNLVVEVSRTTTVSKTERRTTTTEWRSGRAGENYLICIDNIGITYLFPLDFLLCLFYAPVGALDPDIEFVGGPFAVILSIFPFATCFAPGINFEFGTVDRSETHTDVVRRWTEDRRELDVTTLKIKSPGYSARAVTDEGGRVSVPLKPIANAALTGGASSALIEIASDNGSATVRLSEEQLLKLVDN